MFFSFSLTLPVLIEISSILQNFIKNSSNMPFERCGKMAWNVIFFCKYIALFQYFSIYCG